MAHTDALDDAVSESELRRRFGEFVRGERKARRLTVQAAAEKAGLSLKTYVRVERGEPTQDTTIEAVESLLSLEPGTGFSLLHTGSGYPSDKRSDSVPEYHAYESQELRYTQKAAPAESLPSSSTDQRSTRDLLHLTNAITDLNMRDLRYLIRVANGTLRLRLSGQLEQKRADLREVTASKVKWLHQEVSDKQDDSGGSQESRSMLEPLLYLENILKQQIEDIQEELAEVTAETRMYDPRKEFERGSREGATYGQHTETPER